MTSKYENDIQSIINNLKKICHDLGMANDTMEQTIITNIFLYKFANDVMEQKISEFINLREIEIQDFINNIEVYKDRFRDMFPNVIYLNPQSDTISSLIKQSYREDIFDIFMERLNAISEYPENLKFRYKTGEGKYKKLFHDEIKIDRDENIKSNFTRRVLDIISHEKFDFKETLNNSESFDFYSRIFEYLIKDYNANSGIYAEYFTPQEVAKIIAKIIVRDDENKSLEIYDPSAGSGSLLLHLANEIGYFKDNGYSTLKSKIYSQDISGKSTRFFKLNLILNGFIDSLENVIEGDTLKDPMHMTNNSLKEFDYIVSNPPFKVEKDITYLKKLKNNWEEKTKTFFSNDEKEVGRFFAGLPISESKTTKKPSAKPSSYEIYKSFIQHILFSLKENGRAAIVIPSGFLSSGTDKIGKSIIKFIVDNNLLLGVITMPSNIFANTGTNVSIMFLEKNKNKKDIVFINATNSDEEIKVDGITKSVLRKEEEQRIIKNFKQKISEIDFSIVKTKKDIIDNNYSLVPSHYVEFKQEEIDIEKEISDIEKMSKEIDDMFIEMQDLFPKVKESIKKVLDKTKK